MPGREISFINNGIYHVFNKTIDNKKIFSDQSHCYLFLRLIRYYRSSLPRLSYSAFKNLKSDLQLAFEKDLDNSDFHQVEIYAYCLMPNHFHLLLKQKSTQGVSRLMSDITNSFTRYFNLKNERKGPLFLHKFSAKPIMTEEQFMHVSRYIHLNPYSSGIVNDHDALINYHWSSFQFYITKRDSNIINTDYLLKFFAHTKSRHAEFVLNHADYQRNLDYIKHAEKWY